MHPRCSICSDAYSMEEDNMAVLIRRCGHVFCRDCLNGIVASPTPCCPYRCHGSADVDDEDCTELVLSTREAQDARDVPFTIVKRTSEIHRARVVSENKLSQVKGELALLAESVAQQVGSIEFRERCIVSEKKAATSVRYKVDDLQKNLRATLQKAGSLKKAIRGRHRDVRA